MQKILFPTKYVNLSQAYGSGTSHVASYAIDVAGKDAGVDNFYAPFDAVVKKIHDYGNNVWIESKNRVEFSDGTKDYATIMTVHDNSVSNLRVGQSLKQGQTYYQEGTKGKAYGNHVHVEIARGRFSGQGWYQANTGEWVINNKYKPERAFWVDDSHVVMGTQGLKFKEIVEEKKDMVSSTEVWHVVIALAGRNPTQAELKRYVGKWEYKDLFNSVKNWSETARAQKALRDGKKPITDFLWSEVRSNYREPTGDYEAVKDQLYRKK